MSKIVVIGSTNIDVVARVSHLPKPGETVGGATLMHHNGGKGANQAVAAARSGGQVTFITALGADKNADCLIRQFARDGIDTSAITKIEGQPTGTALIFVADDSENCIAVVPGANSCLTPEIIEKDIDVIESAEYILTQLEIPMATIEKIIEVARLKNIKVILNPAPATALNNSILKGLYMITPNRTELSILTNMPTQNFEQIKQATIQLLNLGVQNVVVTLGSEGAYIKNKSIEKIVPAHKVEPTDTTGAGDTFNGAMVTSLAEGSTICEAVDFASKAAAISVTRVGAQSSIPFRNEIK